MRRLSILALAVLLAALAAAQGAAGWFGSFERGRRIYDQATRAEDLQTALALFEDALKQNPPPRRLGEVQFLRGCTAYELQDAPTAVQALTAAVGADPSSVAYRLWLGYAFELDERTTLAVRILRRVWSDANADEEQRAAAREALTRLNEPPELQQAIPEYSLVVPGAVIHHHLGEPFASVVRECLLAARQKLLDHLGIEVTDPVEVVLFNDSPEYHAYHAERQLPRPEWSTACTVYGTIYTYVADADPDRLLVTLTHEYTHVALRSYALDRPIPCWLDEGLAVSISDELKSYRQDLAKAPELLSLKALMVDSFSVYGRRYAHLAYVQSRAMAEDLLQLYGPARLRAYLRLLGQGGNARNSFEQAFGVTMAGYHQWWLTERSYGG